MIRVKPAVCEQRQGFQGHIRGVKPAVNILAQVRGVHDVDGVPITHIPIGHGIIGKSLVGTPAVQRAHPAATLAPAEFSQLHALIRAVVGDNGTDVPLLAAHLPVTVLNQGPGDNGHHGVRGIDKRPAVEIRIAHQVAVGAGVLYGLAHTVD